MNYELIVIGGGSAGHAAARTAASLGLKCALVEAPGTLGGLCILRGCMPSKILLETSNRMREIRDATRFGIEAEPPRLDLEKLRDRLSILSKDFRDYRQHEMKTAGYELLRGEASFDSDHQITIRNENEPPVSLTAKAFVIATGSSPNIPEIPGLRETPYWTSDDVVKMPAVPKHLVILGGGAIGLEAAHCFEGFGSKVTVITRKGILHAHDDDLSEAIEAESKERHIEFLKNTEVESVRYEGETFHLQLKGGLSSLECDALLIATGRAPRTDGLNLEKIGIAMNGDQILTDDRCVTSHSHIFAAGDCTSDLAVVHLAVIQGEIAARNAESILRGGHSNISWERDEAMSGLFTEPQAVEIGMNAKTAAKNGIKIVSGTVHYNDQGKGMIAGSRHGFTKIIADADTHIIIGAVGVGPVVLESSHIVQLAIHQKMTLEQYVAVPHYHPTLVEAWVSAAEAALKEL